MSLFWKDWLHLKKSIMRQMLLKDARFKGMSREQANPYLETEFNKMTTKDLEEFIKKYGIDTKPKLTVVK